MALTKRYLALLVAITIPLVVFFGTEKGISDPNAIEVVCKVVPLSCGLDNDSFRVPIWLGNFLSDDSVGGFEVWLGISKPNLVQFDVDSTWWLLDSQCIVEDEGTGDCLEWGYDSIQVSTTPFDSVNTITQGWEFLEARVFGGDAMSIYDIRDTVFQGVIADYGVHEPPVTVHLYDVKVFQMLSGLSQ